jgi:kynurenine formamidase
VGDVETLVDLTQDIYQGMPVYPGHLRTVVWDCHTHAETAEKFDGSFSYATKGVMFSDHGPTHVDALSHLDPRPDATSIDAMPLSTFVGPAVCLDVSHKAPLEYVTEADLDAAAGASSVNIERGDILLLRTGAEERLAGTPQYTTEYPGLDEQACRWLVRQGMKAFGVDSPSPDNPTSRTYPCHMICRELGMTHYENLANLTKVLNRRFTFIGLPLKIRGGTGSPVRAVAMLHD